MEDHEKLIESLLERATEYGKTSYELVKLKALDKTSDVVSSFIPRSIVIFLVSSFMLFVNIGLGFWIGEILGKIYFGFFVLAAFYGFLGIIIYFFMRKLIKKNVSNYIIKQMLK